MWNGTIEVAELPEKHYYTRWWLRRYTEIGRGSPNKVVLYDRALATDVGAALRYPNEMNEAIGQLKILRARDNEVMDEYIFCDGLGDVR